jgi:lipopolysaccharide transport system ATP-binding protein
MEQTVIRVEGLFKSYRIGEIGTGTLSRDLERWFARIRGKEDPFMRLDEARDRRVTGSNVVWSLRDVSFNVNRGEAVGVIGRNGAGKSTLLKIISRVTAPTHGSITGRGRIASLLEVGTGFHPELTGRENIYLNGTILGMKKREIDRKLDEIIDFSGVELYIDTPVKRYSSGMGVRLAFSVAAHLDSEVLIVDEVLAVGDAQFQRRCLGKMQHASSNQGRTVLFVSHQLGMINTLCQRCIHLEAGRVQADGPTQEVVRGYMNSLAATSKDFHNDMTIPRSDGLPAQVTRLRLVDENGVPRNEFDVFEKKYLEAEFIVEEDGLSFVFFYNLARNQEVLICSHENDLDASRFDIRKKGVYTYRISIPSILKAGTYSFESIGIMMPNQGPVHKLENVLEFNLEELSFDPSLTGFSSKRGGYILADSDYRVVSFQPN